MTSTWSTALLGFMIVLGATALGAGGASAADDCPAAAARFDATRSGGDLAAILDSYAALPAAGCSEQAIYCAGNAVALAHLEAGYAEADRGAEPRAVRRRLAEGRSYGSPWQLLVGIADLSFAEARLLDDGTLFTEAAHHYQDALNTISEPPICSDDGGLPSDIEIGSIHKRMTEALLLAPQFELVRTRAGGCGGVFLQSIRGFTPTFRPLPINFEFDQAEFTPAGRKAAEQLLSCLAEERPVRVTLSGHTDAKGSDGYNMGLSERRLRSVEAFLRNGGFEGELVLMPKGESEPFEPDDASLYDEAELDQLNRRVTLRETAR